MAKANKMTPKERKRLAKKEMALPVTPFEEVDLTNAEFIPRGMTQAYRNTRYMVTIYDNSPTTMGSATRVMVQRHDDMPIPNHWSAMQKIKNEIFGEETIAVEYYPAESQLQNTHNIYWLWIFPNHDLPIPILMNG